LVGCHLTRDPADVALLEGGLQAKGYFDHLLDVAALGGANIAIHADDAEEDLRFYPT